MKKQLFILLAAALAFAGCQRGGKTAEGSATDTVVVVEEEAVPTGITEGAYFTDIMGVTPEGAELALSELVGQTDYVLLDFWASWCGPCRRFIPVLKEIYHMQPKRLEIISCSVDQEEAAWRAALSEEDMPWPQMRENEAHSCSDVYNVQFIPHTVLIDREGTIVGINLDESELERLLYPEDE